MSNFGERLKSLRQARFLTQDELARELENLGCNTTTKCAISQYENNKRLPEAKTLVNIARFFNVSIDYIMGNEGFTNSTDEEKILGIFRQLDEKGKLMVTGYASALKDVKL